VKVSIGGSPVPYDLPEETLPADLDWTLWLGPNEYVHYNHQLNPVTGDPLWGRWRDFKGLGGGDITDWGAHMFDIVQWALDMDRTGPVSFTPHYLDFLQAVKKRSIPVADVETGHRSATVCNLVNIAYELNTPLQWDPQQEKITNHAAANQLLSRKMKKEWAV
jgi:hypothetical protein